MSAADAAVDADAAEQPPKTTKPKPVADQTVRDERIRAGKFNRHYPPPFPVTRDDHLRHKLQRAGRVSGTNMTIPRLDSVCSLAMAARHIVGGRPAFLEFMQMAAFNGEEAAVKWLTVYADLNTAEQATVNWDDVCAAAGVTIRAVTMAIVGTAIDWGRDVGNLVQAVTHPDIVRQAARSAKRIGGNNAEIAFKDRQALLQGAGIFPVPRGQSIHVHANANATAGAQAVASDVNGSVPSFAKNMTQLSNVRKQVQAQLIEVSPVPNAVDAVLDAQPPVFEAVEAFSGPVDSAMLDYADTDDD